MLKKIKAIFNLSKKSTEYQSNKIEIFRGVTSDLAYSTSVLRNYSDYERLYFTSPDVATAIDLIAHYCVTDFNFIGNEKDVERAKEFAKEVKLRTMLINAVRMMLIYGNSYIYIADDENDFGIALQVLNPKSISVLVDSYGEITGYKYSLLDKVLPVERVMHFAYGRIGNSPYGYSIIHPIFDIIEAKKKIERVLTIIAHRMSHPLIHAKVRNQAMLNKVAEMLKERVKDDEMVILNEFVTDEGVEINVLDPKYDVKGLVETLQYLQRQIDKTLKVPKVFYGEGEDVNRATAFAMLKTFSLFLQSIQATVKEELEAKLFPALNLDIEIEFDDITIDDTMMWSDIAVQLYQSGIIDTNEARELIGLLPREEEEI